MSDQRWENVQVRMSDKLQFVAEQANSPQMNAEDDRSGKEVPAKTQKVLSFTSPHLIRNAQSGREPFQDS